jgi:GTP-binding protein
VLAFVLDMAGSEGRDPLEDYRQLRKEVSLYSEELAGRPHLIVANKMDLPEAEAHCQNMRAQSRVPCVAISVTDKSGLEEARSRMKELLDSEIDDYTESK